VKAVPGLPFPRPDSREQALAEPAAAVGYDRLAAGRDAGERLRATDQRQLARLAGYARAYLDHEARELQRGPPLRVRRLRGRQPAVRGLLPHLRQRFNRASAKWRCFASRAPRAQCDRRSNYVWSAEGRRQLSRCESAIVSPQDNSPIKQIFCSTTISIHRNWNPCSDGSRREARFPARDCAHAGVKSNRSGCDRIRRDHHLRPRHAAFVAVPDLSHRGHRRGDRCQHQAEKIFIANIAPDHDIAAKAPRR